jgi:hypothetical protein
VLCAWQRSTGCLGLVTASLGLQIEGEHEIREGQQHSSRLAQQVGGDFQIAEGCLDAKNLEF